MHACHRRNDPIWDLLFCMRGGAAAASDGDIPGQLGCLSRRSELPRIHCFRDHRGRTATDRRTSVPPARWFLEDCRGYARGAGSGHTGLSSARLCLPVPAVLPIVLGTAIHGRRLIRFLRRTSSSRPSRPRPPRRARCSWWPPWLRSSLATYLSHRAGSVIALNGSHRWLACTWPVGGAFNVATCGGYVSLCGIKPDRHKKFETPGRSVPVLGLNWHERAEVCPG